MIFYGVFFYYLLFTINDLTKVNTMNTVNNRAWYRSAVLITEMTIP